MNLEQLYPSQILTPTKSLTEHFDAVVVGSGAGGAVIAKELAEGGLRVAIVEEGKYHAKHRDLAIDAIGRLYRDQGLTSTFGNSVIPVPMGKCVGGTTVINSGTCFRLPAPVLQRWHEERGLHEMDTSELDRDFAKVEKEINVEPVSFELMSRSNTLVHEILAKEGFRGAPIRRNVRNCEGCGMCCYGCSSGAKQSMDVSYLPKALAAGAVIYTGARVTKILKGSGKNAAARGIIAQVNDQTITLLAEKVILSAGTFFTPQLLKSSRLARGNRHLGKHLTLHPATKLFAEFDEEIRGWEGTPQAYYFDGMHEEGLMFEGIFTPPDLAGMMVPLIGKPLVEFVRKYSKMASFGFMITDESEGKMIRLPFVGYGYQYSLTPGDIRRIQKGIAFLSRIFLKGGAKHVYPITRKNIGPLSSLKDVEDFERTRLVAADVECMAFHPLGTCRMGKDETQGVCDQNHQVFGTPNLYLCDGSVIPTSLGVNPQLTIMALATRLSRKLLAKR